MAAKAYRIFTRDMGHVQSSDVLCAESDADAISQARAMRAPFPLEIWDGDRFVKRLTPDENEEPQAQPA